MAERRIRKKPPMTPSTRKGEAARTIFAFEDHASNFANHCKKPASSTSVERETSAWRPVGREHVSHRYLTPMISPAKKSKHTFFGREAVIVAVIVDFKSRVFSRVLPDWSPRNLYLH